MMARSTYSRYFTDPAVTSLGLFLAADADGETVLRRLRDAAARLTDGGAPGGVRVSGGAGEEAASVIIRSNRELRQASLEVFDRTFAITGVLRALAFVVAFIGVLSALMALQLERARELGVLRANGLTPRQLWTLVTAQTGLMGATAGLLAIPAGGILAAVMIFVVNKRSFGWTLRMELGPEIALQALGLALVGALLAGIYPAWRMSRIPPSRALRTE
jgi:putative ABC transport system permease protein